MYQTHKILSKNQSMRIKELNVSKELGQHSPKHEIVRIIKDTYHKLRTGDFLHYALFLPNGKHSQWWEKASFRTK